MPRDDRAEAAVRRGDRREAAVDVAVEVEREAVRRGDRNLRDTTIPVLDRETTLYSWPTV